MKRLLRDYLSSCRLPNLASVWSQVIMASCLVLFFKDKTSYLSNSYSLDLPTLLITGGMVSLLYIYGCLSGDWFDVKWDKQYQPNRPIPSGRIPRRNIGLLALISLSCAGYLATYLPAITWPWVLAMAVVVSLYTLFHKRNFVARVILMAACRGLIIPVACLAQIQDAAKLDLFWLLIMAFSGLSLFFYILSFMCSSRIKLSRFLLALTVVLQLLLANIYLVEYKGTLTAAGAIWVVVVVLSILSIWIHRALAVPNNKGFFIKRSLGWMSVFDFGVALSIALVSGYYVLSIVPFFAVALWYALSRLADAD